MSREYVCASQSDPTVLGSRPHEGDDFPCGSLGASGRKPCPPSAVLSHRCHVKGRGWPPDVLEVRAGSAGLQRACGPSRSTGKLGPGSTSCPVRPSFPVSSAEDGWGSPERQGCLLGVSVPTHSSASFLQGRDTTELARDSAHRAHDTGVQGAALARVTGTLLGGLTRAVLYKHVL